MDTTLRPGANSALIPGSVQRAPAAARALAPVVPAKAAPEPPRLSALKPGMAERDFNLQSNVARAQQALDYLERVASELESVKSTLSARLAGSRSGGGAAELEARVRQLSATLASRATQAGGNVDARLEFEHGQSARQSFRITGFEPAVLRAASPLTLAFSIGNAQVSASFHPEMSAGQIAGKLDRALAPLDVRAQLDVQGRLVFSADEATWPAVRDNIVLSGRGRASTEAIPADLNLQGVESGNADAMRQSLRDVVQALERVRRSQAAASAALSQAAAELVQPDIAPETLALSTQDFSAIAAGHDYRSLLALTSALSGVSRDRVLALLGLG